MKKSIILLLLIHTLLLAEGEEKILTYSFNLTKRQKAKAYADMETKKVYVVIDKQKVWLKDIDESFYYPDGFGFSALEFGDFNFDGYSDIGLLMGIGYGGTNVFRDYYFYDSQTKSFHKYLKNVSNLTSNKITKRLSSDMKSGQEWSYRYYAIEDNRPYLFLKRDSRFDDKTEEYVSYFFPDSSIVIRPKAYFYDRPNGKKSKVYIIKGDRVKILDIDEDTLGWVRVEYRGEKKVFRKWVKIDTLEFQEI